MTILLDTNAYAALVAGHPGVARRVREARRVLFSVVVLGELLAGFRHGSKEQRNRRLLEEYLRQPYFDDLPITRATTERFARIWSELRKAGRPIPTNDIWIAAQAMESGGELISFDRHFEAVDGLFWSRPEEPEALP